MRVQLGTIDVSDEIRRAMRVSQGRSGKATRAEVRAMGRAGAMEWLEHCLDVQRHQEERAALLREAGEEVVR